MSPDTPPKIILYAHPGCPWARRAITALQELSLEYEQVFIDLEKPREPWYLEINPRGLIPSLSYNGEIITESAVVAQFLADAHPSHLLPVSTPVENALVRARINFFVDAFISKFVPVLLAAYYKTAADEKDASAEEVVKLLEKEVEPLLPELDSKGPFFGGSERLTMAEVLTASFLVNLRSFAKPKYGIASPKLLPLTETLPRFKRWADAVTSEPSVMHGWDEETFAEKAKKKLAELATAEK